MSAVLFLLSIQHLFIAYYDFTIPKLKAFNVNEGISNYLY